MTYLDVADVHSPRANVPVEPFSSPSAIQLVVRRRLDTR